MRAEIHNLSLYYRADESGLAGATRWIAKGVEIGNTTWDLGIDEEETMVLYGRSGEYVGHYASVSTGIIYNGSGQKVSDMSIYITVGSPGSAYGPILGPLTRGPMPKTGPGNSPLLSPPHPDGPHGPYPEHWDIKYRDKNGRTRKARQWEDDGRRVVDPKDRARRREASKPSRQGSARERGQPTRIVFDENGVRIAIRGLELAGAGAITYLVVSEGSRLFFPLRNLVPVP